MSIKEENKMNPKEMYNGLIIKNIADFYYVEIGETVYECKERGILRKEMQIPLVGDNVILSMDTNGKGVIENILERKNSLQRPMVANVDRICIVISILEPAPNLMVIDRLTAVAEDREIEPVIIINKTDLMDVSELAGIYVKSGFKVFEISCKNKTGIDEVRNYLKEGINVFTGNSGVGKSSILNLIAPQYSIKTGDISIKLGRGKHTTRHIEMYKSEYNTYIIDTPGFSSMERKEEQFIRKENLQYAFREFSPYLHKCKFTSCTHTGEKGCAIGEAYKNGLIQESRYLNYISMYKEAAEIKDWQIK